jgi:hypothetical protein
MPLSSPPPSSASATTDLLVDTAASASFLAMESTAASASTSSSAASSTSFTSASSASPASLVKAEEKEGVRRRSYLTEFSPSPSVMSLSPAQRAITTNARAYAAYMASALLSSAANELAARGYIVVGPSFNVLVPLPQLQFEGNTVESAATLTLTRRREFLDF